MNWQDVAGAIKQYAPGAEALLGVASLIPGVGAITAPAAAAIGALSKALGTDPTPDAIHQAIVSDPQAALKLGQAELDYKLKLSEQTIEKMKIEAADRESARSMNVETTKATGARDRGLYAMSWAGIVVALFVFLVSAYLAVMKLIDAITAQMIGNMTGIFLAKYSTVFDFWFGGAFGQTQKTDAAATEADKQ
jgi:hypothetical protein